VISCGSDIARRFIYRRILNLALVRYIHILDYLESRVSGYENILLTDVRDVVFQEDPFRDPLPAEIVAFLEAPKMKFGVEPLFNDPWVRGNYGDAMLERLAGERISCCGTVMGSSRGIVSYLRAFAHEIPKLRSVAHGADTSVHNVLVRLTLTDRVAIVDNLHGAVATIGCNAIGELRLSSSGLVLGEDHRPVPVVHQYDRHPELVNCLSKALLGAHPRVVDSAFRETG